MVYKAIEANFCGPLQFSLLSSNQEAIYSKLNLILWLEILKGAYVFAFNLLLIGYNTLLGGDGD